MEPLPARYLTGDICNRHKATLRVLWEKLHSFAVAGFTFDSVDDGDGELASTKSLVEVFEAATAVDEARIYLRHKNFKGLVWVLVVFGNEPWELFADYTACPELDAVLAD